MNLCESINYAINEGVKDFIKEKFKIKDDAFEKTEPDHCVKSIAKTKDGWVGFSHRAYHEFKVGDKLFDAKWDDDGNLTEEEVEKLKFVERGAKKCKNQEDCKQASANFAQYVS